MSAIQRITRIKQGKELTPKGTAVFTVFTHEDREFQFEGNCDQLEDMATRLNDMAEAIRNRSQD